MTSRYGFTLVEMLVALVLVSLVGVGITSMLKQQQRLSVSQVEQASLQGNVRSGTNILTSELRELATSATGTSDILAIGGTALRYRAMRSLGLACEINRTQVKLRASPLYGARGIVAGQDSLLLFAEGNSTLSSDDKWVAAPITAVSAGNCSGVSAVVLATSLDTLIAPMSAYQLDAPARTFEVMELGPVTQGGESWLGARSVSGGQSLTPVVGPLSGTGISFVYLDSLGNTTATRANIRSIQVTLRGRTDRDVRTLSNPGTVQRLTDSLVTLVSLRNTPRP